MSAPTLSGALLAMLLRALRDDAVLASMVHNIGDDARGAPVPAIIISEPQSTPWGSKDRPGVELRTDIVVVDRGDAERIEVVAKQVADVLAALPRESADRESGPWVIVRHRSQRLRNGERRTTLTLRVRSWSKTAQY